MDEDDRFIEQHRPLVRSIAQKLRSEYDLNCELEELVACGFRGLLEAKQRFDETRGVQFQTFAYYRVRGAMLDDVRRMGYLPRRIHARIQAARVVDMAAEDVAVLRALAPDRRDDVEETARVLEDTLAKITTGYVLAAVGQERDAKEDSPETEMLSAESSGRIRKAVGSLPERERALVNGFYFEGRRFDEVAAELGISKSWASRLHAKALSLLRDALDEGG
jgi:RNA polymerase sigma factor for flagellar operon FliA